MSDLGPRPPSTWRDVQAARPAPVASALAAWHATPGNAEPARMSDAIDAYEAALEIYRRCDEPGCTREGTCGFPVDDGYRRTCFEHWEKPA